MSGLTPFPVSSRTGNPTWTVIEIATGECHGTFDCEAEVSLCQAFAKLTRDEVEVL